MVMNAWWVGYTVGWMEYRKKNGWANFEFRSFEWFVGFWIHIKKKINLFAVYIHRIDENEGGTGGDQVSTLTIIGIKLLFCTLLVIQVRFFGHMCICLCKNIVKRLKLRHLRRDNEADPKK